jgi:putative ABC transport system permease protein
VADEPTGNLDEATGKQIVDLFTKHAERGMTLVLVTHDTSLAQRCDRVVRLRSGRIDCERANRFMSIASYAAKAPQSLAAPALCACANLRGGLRGFYVFIACIALGVMAIAGVGSVAASLGEGLAREGRTLLGGDLSVLADPARGQAGRSRLPAFARRNVGGGDLRAMARTGDGRLALVELKAVDGAYPMLGELTLDPTAGLRSVLARARRRIRRGRRSDLAGAARSQAGDRVTVGSATIQIRSVVDAEPDKLAGGIGFGPRLLVSEAALRATGLLQPGSLVRWIYRVRLPDNAPTIAPPPR